MTFISLTFAKQIDVLIVMKFYWCVIG